MGRARPRARRSSGRTGRWLLLVPLVASLGCAPESSGRISAEGAWADGDPIKFSALAQAGRVAGRVQVWASSYRDRRFAGLRISYDPAVVTAPGTYQVDPAPLGSLEIYCVRPDDSDPALSQNRIEYEVSSAVVVVDKLPDQSSNQLEGTFEQVVLRRDQTILQLSHGRFEADVP